MPRHHRVILVLLAALSISLVTATTGAAGSTRVRCPEIHVGYLARFSGPEAERGVNALDAARLATAEFSAEHPDCPVRVVPLDLDAAPALEAGRLPFVVVSATRTDLGTQGWRMFHRLGATNRTEGAAIAQLITRELRPGRVALVDDCTIVPVESVTVRR